MNLKRAILYVMTMNLQKLHPDTRIDPDLVVNDRGMTADEIEERTRPVKDQDYDGAWRIDYVRRVLNQLRMFSKVSRLGPGHRYPHAEKYTWRLTRATAENIARTGMWKKWKAQFKEEILQGR